MQKLNRFFILFALIGFQFSALNAQTTILNETLLTQGSFNTFTEVSVTGDQIWHYDNLYGAVCSGYSMGVSYANEDWLISPAMNLAQADIATLTFSHTRGSASVMNIGVSQGWYKVFATANYTGDPLTTNWVELQGLNQNIPEAWQYISSGDINIPQAAKSANTRIAFRYYSLDNQSATWEIKNVKVTADINTGNDAVFKITNWNTEWLGCDTFGPTDEDQQLQNVVTAMLTMNSDLYCIQEVSNTPSTPTISSIVSQLGSDTWAGAIVPSNTGDCNQRQGIIYKKDKVQLVTSMELSTGNSSQGNTYYYNWSNGRYPAVYNINLLSGSTVIPVTVVNIHAKAEDSNDASNYTRRLGGSQSLKTILDGTNYNSKNVILIGDFNDYLVGTTSNTCNCTISPYKNFIDDTAHYTGITQGITDVNTNWGTHPIIENIIISDELTDNYIAGSAAQEVSIPQSVNDYYWTTSDHLPVTARFHFSTLSVTEALSDNQKVYTVYPNPVKEILNIELRNTLNDTHTAIYDLAGRQIYSGTLNEHSIDVSNLPAGIYMLKIGSLSTKFVKE